VINDTYLRPWESLAINDDAMWSRCRAGHDAHETQIVFPDRRYFAGRNIGFTTYDWAQYLDKYDCYCTGQDVISRQIDVDGAWERNESQLFADVCAGDRPGIVVDYGCQIGWYSTIAAAHQRFVIAVDVSPENLRLATLNMRAAGWDHWLAVNGWVDESALPVDADVHIRAAKLDIEGAEIHAVRQLAQPLAAGHVDYLFIEISPVFNDTYRALIAALVAWDYVPFRVPEKDQLRSLALQTLVVKYQIGDIDEFLEGLNQTDVVFIRKALL